MHMSDSLVSAAVGTTMAVVSAGALGYSIKKIAATDLNNNKVPMMGVMGAFVFAAQMINFTIPGTGSSGHIGGGILLAAILGPYPAFLVITSVLLIQALLFADGGLLALGCNIFNMGFLTCFVAYPLIYRMLLRKSITPKRLSIASLLSVVLGLQLGAFAVVLETTASKVTELPFGTFLILMQPIHLAIGIVEGIITGAVLCFVFKVRKEIILDSFKMEATDRKPLKPLILFFAVAAVICGSIISSFASRNPDGLVWAIHKVTGNNEITNSSDSHTEAKKLQDKTAVMQGYSLGDKKNNPIPGTALSGIIGGVVTLVVTITAGVVIVKLKKNRVD